MMVSDDVVVVFAYSLVINILSYIYLHSEYLHYHWCYIPFIYLAIYRHYRVHSDSCVESTENQMGDECHDNSKVTLMHFICIETKTLRWKHYAFAALRELIFPLGNANLSLFKMSFEVRVSGSQLLYKENAVQ